MIHQKMFYYVIYVLLVYYYSLIKTNGLTTYMWVS